MERLYAPGTLRNRSSLSWMAEEPLEQSEGDYLHASRLSLRLYQALPSENATSYPLLDEMSPLFEEGCLFVWQYCCRTSVCFYDRSTLAGLLVIRIHFERCSANTLRLITTETPPHCDPYMAIHCGFWCIVCVSARESARAAKSPRCTGIEKWQKTSSALYAFAGYPGNL